MNNITFHPQQSILIIDECLEILSIFHQLFEPEYRVLSTTHGDSLLEDAVIEQPDIIILDASLSDMDAVEMCAHLKGDPKTETIPVILMSKGASANLQRGFEVGVADYIFKPFNQDLVKARINSHLQLKQANSLLHQHHHLDVVSHLPDESYFLQELEKDWLHTIRSRETLSLILIDIDGFSHFREIYGAAAYDIALMNIGRVLEDTCHRAKDFISHWEEQRFAIYVSSEKHENVMTFANKLRESVATTEFVIAGYKKEFHVTASLAVVSIRPDLSMKSHLSTYIQAAIPLLSQARQSGDVVVGEQLESLKPIYEHIPSAESTYSSGKLAH